VRVALIDIESIGQVMQGQVGVIVKVGFGLIMLMMAIRANASSEAYVLHAYAAGVAVVAVQIDLKSPGTRVTGAMAKGGSGHAENWFGMIKRAQPMAAITGTYFDVGSRMPVGDIQIDGVLRHFGGLGTALCVSEGNHAKFIDAPKDHHMDWSKYDFVIRCGPRLVTGGAPGVRAKQEGFRDPALQVPSGRLGIGITKDHCLILAGTRQKVSLARWAKVMKALGATDAMNLDAGPCMGLYANGETIIKPKCALTNLVLVYRDRRRHETAKRERTPVVASASMPVEKP